MCGLVQDRRDIIGNVLLLVQDRRDTVGNVRLGAGQERHYRECTVAGAGQDRHCRQCAKQDKTDTLFQAASYCLCHFSFLTEI